MTTVERHATADEIERYVLDALAAPNKRFLERHVQACAECARALRRHAAAEVALWSLWPQVERPLAPVIPLRPALASPARVATPIWGRRAPWGSLGALAAAAIAIFVAVGTPGGQLSPRTHAWDAPPMSLPSGGFSSFNAPLSSQPARCQPDGVSACPAAIARESSVALASWGTCAAGGGGSGERLGAARSGACAPGVPASCSGDHAGVGLCARP